MKKIFLLILSAVIINVANAQIPIRFYVVADQDDWQLFMAKKLASDLNNGNNKIVIITLTAGDAGNGSGTFGGASASYYSSRERGAIYSTKMIADFTNPPYGPFNNTYPLPTVQNVSINGKTLAKYYFGDPGGDGAIINYFLRLPDGGPAGAGYAGTGNVSLKKLKEGTIANMTSVDGVNTYTWTQLVNTITSIIFAERGSETQAWLNTSHLNTTLYPDISDHVFSSTAAQEAVAVHLAIGINEFVMDYSSNSAANLTTEEYQLAANLFGVYNWSMLKNRYPSQLTSTIRSWFPMEDFIQKRAPVGILPITISSFTGTLSGKTVVLDWTTSVEVNSKEFQLEKSYDGINYQKIATVPAAGNSTTPKTYSHTDLEAAEFNYYRLNMIDLDGSSKRSNVVLVKNPGITQDILVTTNPFNDFIGLRFTKLPKGELAYRLLDMSGKQIAFGKMYNTLTTSIRIYPNTSLSSGIYILQIENDGRKYSLRLLKQ